MRLLSCFVCIFLWSSSVGQELCDNGVDDDGDGLIDLNDPECDCSSLGLGISSIIPNHSFEDTACCPSNHSQVNCSAFWHQASAATSDYFNSCGYIGGDHQFEFPELPLPYGGSGWMGFFNGTDGIGVPAPGVYKEYIGTCLTTAMDSGRDYRLDLLLAFEGGDTALELTIYGTPNCQDLPWPGYACPIGHGSWIRLGAKYVIFPARDSLWIPASIEFTAPVGITAIAIGGECTPSFVPPPQPGTPPTQAAAQGNYYYIDELVLFDRDSVGAIFEVGNLCSNNLQLTAEIDTTGGSWQWYNDGIALIGETSSMLDLMPYGIEGVYTAVYTLNGACIAIDHTVDSSFGNSTRNLEIFTNDTIICSGATIPISATGTIGFTYQWSPPNGVSDPMILNPEITPTDTANYYILTASYPDCPDTSVGIRIGMQHTPEVDLGDDKQVCYGESVPLESLVSPYRSDYSYTWRTPTAGLEHSQSANNTFVADSSMAYHLEVSTPIGCKGADSIYIHVYPPDFASASADTGFCPPSGGVPLWATGGRDYQWVPDYGLDDAHSATPWANPATPTLYQVVVTNEVGCVDSQEVFVDVYPNAVVYMPDTVVIYPGERYLLETQGNTHYFDWFPPSGISSTNVSNPEFFPDVRTRYFVTATTEHGCTVKDSIDILVKSTVLGMPNAFKPGSDENGSFKVEMRGIAQLNAFTVFNRWGNKVFETTDIREGWDGSYNSIPQPLGVYVYRIDAITDGGRRITKQGNVTLIR